MLKCFFLDLVILNSTLEQVPRGSGLYLLWKRPGRGSRFSGLEQTARPAGEHWTDQSDGRDRTHWCHLNFTGSTVPFISCQF